MHKFFFSLVIFLSFCVKGQVVLSSCTGADSIVKKYKKDADRLAVRRAYHINSTYKDSVKVNKPVSDAYMAALMAVYNATTLPVRDTVVSLLSLHTKPDPEVNGLTVKANPSLPWMQNLQNSVIPTGNAPVDYLITKYHLQEVTYYQSTLYDVVAFKTDTNCNIIALNHKFAAISGVVGSDPDNTFNDVKNITDSINPAFTMLVYSYGFGSCADGCDYRTYWTFKVYTDCRVEYVGRSGDAPLFTGIEKNNTAFENVNLFPNPVKEKLYITYDDQKPQNIEVQILNLLSQPVLQLQTISGNNSGINISGLPAGIYYVRLKDHESIKIFKIIKE